MSGKTDIIDTATEARDFKTFIEALEKAELKETLTDQGPFTIFAPLTKRLLAGQRASSKNY